MKHWSALIAIAMALSAGCSRPGIETKEAVRAGIIEHLTTRAGLDVKQMDVDVSNVSFRQGEADAVVSFRPKGSPDAASGMSMRYTLEAKGDKWVVKGKSDMSGSPHSGAMPGGAMPGGAMPGGEAPAGGAMPPGHPPVEPKGGTAMPPGHPPVEPKK